MPVHTLFQGRTPKESESITDCQDYFAIDKEKACFAIADGSSQSFYPAIWAELLVDHFCHNPELSGDNWRAWLEPIQAHWLTEVKYRVDKAKFQGKPVWIEGFNGLSMQRSATSTFVGIQFQQDRMSACVVGDSCLFILRNENLEGVYPIQRSEDFNDRPEYFASYPKDNHFQPRFLNIELDRDEFSTIFLILATDALSEYILRCLEQEECIFPTLLKIRSQHDFENFVKNARHSNSTLTMKGDDVTLMVLGLDIDNSLTEPRFDIDNSLSEPKLSRSSPEYYKPLSSDNANLSDKKIIERLKYQKLILALLLLFATFWILWDFIAAKISIGPRPIQIKEISPAKPLETLPKSTVIYKDENLTKPLIQLIANLNNVKISQVRGNSYKVEVDLYAHKDTSIEQTCRHPLITLSERLRSSPYKDTPKNLVGTLQEQASFKNISQPDTEWCMVRFEGFIKK
jgi:hypothetical protein